MTSATCDEGAFEIVARLDELDEGSGRCVQVAGRTIALFRAGTAVYALDDQCPHQDASLAEGDLEDGVLMCPLHGWTFDVATGQVLNGLKSVRVHEVRIEAGNVLVALR